MGASDKSIVVTRNPPNNVLVFDNAGMGEIPPLGAPFPSAPFAVRHAADMAADLAFDFWEGPHGTAPISPAAIFTKGQQFKTTFSIGYVFELHATLTGGSEVISAPTVAVVSHRYEWIFVGANASDARWVFMDRLVSQPS